MLRQIKNYIVDDKFRITILNNQVDLMNYTDIVTIQKNMVSIDVYDKKINIKGKNMSLKKLLDNEILIRGLIKKIEL